MPKLGKIEEFDPTSTNINCYLERLEQYFIANGVGADTGERFKRRATLISVIGSKAYDVLSDLCSSEAPSKKTYVKGSGLSLFRRNWLFPVNLDWKKICSIHVSDPGLTPEVKSQLHNTVQCHSNVFKPGLGTIQGITAKLEMKPDAQPKFSKARPVPYALQEAVDAEYHRLESEGIVEKVEFSEWATPMVHVPKAAGTTRSCGDYAVTVNPNSMSLKIFQRTMDIILQGLEHVAAIQDDMYLDRKVSKHPNSMKENIIRIRWELQAKTRRSKIQKRNFMVIGLEKELSDLTGEKALRELYTCYLKSKYSANGRCIFSRYVRRP
ncbi:Uncharacterized protein K02A2.6 [Stylophora pistillata]|uniref:Uncharacterized protein K02A2.6 n=1 Tax=Stylophora pistillata TaxID=50429 RepID=A0A2B4SAU7_STYPI|nr:Uncharacterized protein K02A2.6 [Stylophora pistillata]